MFKNDKNTFFQRNDIVLNSDAEYNAINYFKNSLFTYRITVFIKYCKVFNGYKWLMENKY